METGTRTMPAASIEAPSLPSSSETVTFTNPDTGAAVELSSGSLSRPAAVRRALLALDAQSAWARSAAPADESAVTLDVPARTYRFARYPPLGFFFDVRLFVVLGAFFIAGCAQLYFFLFVKRLTCPFAAHYPKHHFRPLP
jgi:hypothetical protein